MSCPLCSNSSTSLIGAPTTREFYLCTCCDLLFLNPGQRISQSDEKARYEKHNNDVNDPRYREFVTPLLEAICAKISPGTSGLDFGAGTGPVLAEMLEARSYRIQRYDPLFWPNPRLLQFQYDFVFASEVVEHFFTPGEEFRRLRGLLRPRGLLAIMTLLRSADTDLSRWHYLKDPTHVCAYSKSTFHWIAEKFSFAEPEFQGDRVILLAKR